MHDAFSKSAGPNSRRRQVTGRMHFSPSYGVRMGFIKDPNWPPAQMPEEGTAAARRHLRIKCRFTVRGHRGQPVETTGDLSAGGAKFTVSGPMGTEIDVLSGTHAVRAEVLQELKGAGQFTYRVKFVDPKAGAALFDTLYFAN